MKSRLVLVLVSAVFYSFPCFAGESNFPVLCWEGMGLSSFQQVKIKELDKKWDRINNNLTARIVDDQNILIYLLNNHEAADNQIRQMHNKILNDKKTLRAQALDIFLEKRSVLTDVQKKTLHKIILKQGA